MKLLTFIIFHHSTTTTAAAATTTTTTTITVITTTAVFTPFAAFNCFSLSYSPVVQGCYAGNAVGFRLTSLTKLVDTRSNKPRLTLLHFLVDEVCRQNHDAIEFVDSLSQPLSVAARYDITSISYRRETALQKWKSGIRRQYFTDIIGLSSTTVT